MATTWRDLILDQLDFYWNAHLHPRMAGLTDEEYLWEPVAGAWSLRRGEAGVVRIEAIFPEPPVPPVTTIAWRMAHVGRDVFGKRARALFGGSDAPADAVMFDDRHWPEPLPLTAAGGLEMLEQGYTLWREGIAGLDDEALLRPLGLRGGPYAEDSFASLAAHLNREFMAHGAEMCLLRDLHRVLVDQNPLERAMYAGDAEHVARILATAPPLTVANLASRIPSLLAEVAALHHWDVVRLLASNGFPLTSATAAGITALHYAAAAGALDEVRWLITKGANASAVESVFGFDPAGWADHFKQPETAEYLRAAAKT